MTAVLAIDFYYQILVFADCRVSWQYQDPHKPPQLQDNLQKVYPCGPAGVFGFAGNISAAKAITKKIRQEAQKKPLPPSAETILEDISLWSRDAYRTLPRKDKQYLEIMYIAADYGKISLMASNVTFTNKILAKMVSPDFTIERKENYVALGYATCYPEEQIFEIQESLLRLGLDASSRRFQMAVALDAIGEELIQIGGDPVGGLFSVGRVTASGVTWLPYSKGNIELAIEDGKFIQYDHSDDKRVPLKVVWEFDARTPEAGGLIFKLPD